jgi:xanthine dehydrogenase accessory factor
MSLSQDKFKLNGTCRGWLQKAVRKRLFLPDFYVIKNPFFLTKYVKFSFVGKELEVWQFSAEKLREKKSVILLIVVRSVGSSPGRQGFKMAVAEDDICGSIGGGVMEVSLVEKAKLKIKTGKLTDNSEIVEQVHRKNTENSSGMICSGRQTVVFFPLSFSHLGTIEKIVSALKKHLPCRLQMTNVNLQISTLVGNNDFYFRKLSENEFVYEENLGYKQKLFIVGGGHCALALSELMSKMDFYITLFDDRADLSTIEKNRFVQEKRIIESYGKIDEFIESGTNHYVVVMTLGFKFDEIVIRRLFDKNFKYFGVLGSKAKMKTLLRTLEKEGFNKEKLSQIRTPIGLRINSRTPEEIAVSIAAEIIAVKNSA